MSHIWSIPRCFWGICTFLSPALDRRLRRLLVAYLLAFIVLRDRKSAARVAALYPPRHRSSFTRLKQKQSLPAGAWLQEAGWDALRELGWRPGDQEPVYFIGDTTLKGKRGKKMHNLHKFMVPGQKRYILGHAFVAVILVYRGQRIPPAIAPYKSQEWCALQGVKFQSQGQIAAALLKALTPPTGLTPIVLLDSGLFNRHVLGALPKRGWRWVSVAQRQRVLVQADGSHLKLGDYLQTLVQTKRAFRRITAQTLSGKERRYWTRREPRTLRHVGEVVLVFSGRKKEQARQLKPLVTNVVEWSAVEVCNHYACRWHIEVWWKEMKQELGLGDYQNATLTAQRNHVRLAALGYTQAVRLSLRSGGKGGESLLAHLRRARGQIEHAQWRWLHGKMQSQRGAREAAKCLERLLMHDASRRLKAAA